METRRLGRTEHRSTVAVLGGAAFWASSPPEARAGFELAVEAGVNHLDIAPQYGAAEDVVGPLVPAVRDGWFVAGKTLRANPAGVRAQFDDTRRKLGCDVLDLYQAHGVTSLDELDRRAGALETIVRLRDEGATRFAGITGHDHGAPAAHAEAIRRYDLDTVMFPVNAYLWSVPSYRDDAEALLELCAANDVGVMAIKAGARRPWSDGKPLAAALEGDDATAERWATSWYEPLRDAALRSGVAFTLSVPGVHALCTPGDLGLLPSVLEACATYTPLDEAEREAAVAAAPDTMAEIFPIPR
jgi:aryl-alcohol dehydrogenase-like predicted oxidoreductase